MDGEYKPRSCVTKSSIFPLRIFMKLLASNILQESVRVQCTKSDATIFNLDFTLSFHLNVLLSANFAQVRNG